MDDHSDGPTGVWYIAIGALVVAVGLLAYFIVSGDRDGANSAGLRGVRYEPPVASPSRP